LKGLGEGFPILDLPAHPLKRKPYFKLNAFSFMGPDYPMLYVHP